MQQSKWDQERYSQDKPRSFKERFLNTPLRYVIGLCIAGILLFGLWRMTDPGTEILPLGRTIPIIKPLEGPTKIKPIANLKDTHQDKTIYQKLSDTEDLKEIEHLLGDPEEPITRTPSLPDEFISEFLEDKAELSLSAPKTVGSDQTSSPLKITNTSKETLHNLPKEDELEEVNSANVAISGSNVKSSRESNTPSQELYCLQLGTLKTEEQAKLEWKRLSSRQVLKPYFLKLKPEFKKVDLGNDMGVRIRLITGSLPKKEAQKLCQELIKISTKHNITLGCRVKKR